MKINKMQFFDVPDDSGGGAVEILDAPASDAPPVDPTPTPTPTPAAPTFDPKALATEFGTVLRDTLGNQRQPEPPKAPMTPEEAKKLLNFFDVDDEFMKQFGDMEQQKVALERFRDGLVKHMDTIVQMRLQEAVGGINAKYDPVVTTFQQQQQEAAESRFNTKYEQLANPALKPILQAVANSLVSSGKKFATEAEGFEALAKGVEAVIQQTNPQFTLSAASATTQQNQQKSSSSLPVTSPGGGGGGGGGGNQTQLKGALGILGPVKG